MTSVKEMDALEGDGLFWPMAHQMYNGSFSSVQSGPNDSWNASGETTEGRKGATIVSPMVMFMTGLLGNTLALVVLYRTKTEIRRTMFYTLVAGLAWTDITGQVLTSPVSIYTYINGLNWPGGEQLCKFNGFIMGCFGLSTPCIVCAMAVERFMALKCPFFYSKHCTRSMARVTIVLLWGIVLMVSIMPLMGFGRYSLQYPGTWCFLDFHTTDPILSAYGYLYAGLNLVIILLMTGCNVFVAATLLRVRFMRKYALSRSCGHCGLSTSGYDPVCSSPVPLKRKQQHAVQMQMIWLMCAITTVFAVCWAPLMLQIVRTLATGKSDFMSDLLGVRLASINQILDPWLYILVRRSFIQKIGRCFKNHLCLHGHKSAHGRACHRTPRIRLFPPPNDLVADANADEEVGLRIHAHNDIVGLYRPCPHCAARRHRETSPNVSVPNDSCQRLPDVMGSNDSHHSDIHSLPDVTPEGSQTRPHEGRQEVADNSITSGYYDTDSEPIYVDVFLLPRDKVSVAVHSPDRHSQLSQVTSDLVSQTAESTDDVSVFNEGASTSGVFSMYSQPPRRPFRSVDIQVNNSEKNSQQHQSSRTRRTKSYT